MHSESDPGRAAVIRQAVSVSIATGLYGISFGALSIVAGLSLAQTMVLSAFMFAGSSQFAFVGVIGAGGSVASAIATSGLLGVRNGLYGVQLGPLLGFTGWRRLLATLFTIDESTAVSTAQSTQTLRRVGFWWGGVGVYICWNTLTFVGALAGNAIGDPQTWGLDAAASAAFLGLLWPRLGRAAARVCAALAVVIAIGLIPVAPAGVPVLGAAVAAIAVGIWEGRRAVPEEVPAS